MTTERDDFEVAYSQEAQHALALERENAALLAEVERLRAELASSKPTDAEQLAVLNYQLFVGASQRAERAEAEIRRLQSFSRAVKEPDHTLDAETLDRHLDYLFRDVAMARHVWLGHPEADMGEALQGVLEMATKRTKEAEAKVAAEGAISSPASQKEDDDTLTRVHPMDQVTHSPTAASNRTE